MSAGLAVSGFPLLFSGAGPSLLRPDDRELVGHDAAVYLEYCAACHGSGMTGEPDWQTPKPDGRMPAPPHDETGHTWHYPSALLFAMTKFGVHEAAGLTGYETDMPAYQDILSDHDIIAALSYIKSTWPEEVQDRHDRLDAAASSRN